MVTEADAAVMLGAAGAMAVAGGVRVARTRTALARLGLADGPKVRTGTLRFGGDDSCRCSPGWH